MHSLNLNKLKSKDILQNTWPLLQKSSGHKNQAKTEEQLFQIEGNYKDRQLNVIHDTRFSFVVKYITGTIGKMGKMSVD